MIDRMERELTIIKINNLCFMIVVLVIFDITTVKIRKKAESAKL